MIHGLDTAACRFGLPRSRVRLFLLQDRREDSAMASPSVTYPPLDTLKPVADDLWIVDSGPQHMGISLPVRMTVIRLRNGDVLLHSPTRYVEALRQEIEALGPIRHLVAPNIAHWTHLREWQTRCPGAE